jgi:hypothetical protein
VYAIAVAILISSATAECSSSVIKREKTRIRSTMLQRRLEVYFCCCWAGNFTISGQKRIIDVFTKSSMELSKALL